MHEYDHIGGWVVEIEWAAGTSEPKWSVWFDECGHAPMIEKPAEFARAMLDFADELERRGA